MLQTVGLGVRFGGVTAVDDLSVEVGPGELVGLIGPNGAGKTTTIDAISGFVPHVGRVVFDGEDLSGTPPHVRARAGIARTWQSLELFDDLTVRQQCEVAARRVGLGTVFADLVRPGRADASAVVVDRALESVGLAEVAASRPGDLSHGHQKLVGVARALAASPRMLLLDEPAAGLDSSESMALGRRLRDLVDGGSGVGVDGASLGALLIDHDTRLVFEICDRVVVQDFGRVIAAGAPDDVRRDPAVVAAYLGSGHT